jgi:catalase (peroxidase I)
VLGANHEQSPMGVFTSRPEAAWNKVMMLDRYDLA